MPIAEGRTFDLALKGDLALAAIQAIDPTAGPAAASSLQAHVRGTLAAPDVDGTFGIVGGRGRFEDTRVTAVQVKGRSRAARRSSSGRARESSAASVDRERQPPDRAARRGPRRAAPLRGDGRGPLAPRGPVSQRGRPIRRPSSSRCRATSRRRRRASRACAARGGSRGSSRSRRRARSASPPPPRGGSPTGASCRSPSASRGRSGRSRRAPTSGSTGTPAGSVVFAGPFDLRLVGPFVPDTTLAGPARVDLRASGTPRAPGSRAGSPWTGGRVTLEHAGLHRLAAQGRGALPRRPRGGRRDRGGGRRPPRRVRRDELRPPPPRPRRAVDRGRARPGRATPRASAAARPGPSSWTATRGGTGSPASST